MEQVYLNATRLGEVSAFFDFTAHVPRGGTSEQHSIHLGVDISPANRLITYCFAIGSEIDGEKAILRKIHFDIDTDSSTEPKPMSHIQLGGRFPPGLTKHGYTTPDLCGDPSSKLDKPRILCQPPAFALLMHWAFLEYQSTEPALGKFVHSPEWVNCVKITEKDVLHKYFTHGHEEMATEKNADLSFITSCYR